MHCALLFNSPSFANVAHCACAVPKVEDVNWRVDYILSSSVMQSVNAPAVRLDLQLSKPSVVSSTLA